MKRHHYVGWNTLLLLPLLLGPPPGRAAALPDSYINISGTVIAGAPCKINGERPIEVNFGDDVVITRIDNTNYEKTIDYTLECTGATTNSLRMKIQGTPASFSTAMLATLERSDLVLLFRVNGFPWGINTWMNFQYPAKPVLTVVPAKLLGSQLTTGRFSATATLLVEYQ